MRLSDRDITCDTIRSMFSRCPHCQPYDEYTHIDDWISAGIKSAWNYLFVTSPQADTKRSLTDRLWILILSLLRAVGVCKFIANPDRSKLYNRGLIFFDEAKRSGIDIKAVTIFGQYVHEYVYEDNDTTKLFHKLPNPDQATPTHIDDKAWTKKQLNSAGTPVPKGDSFWRKHDGLNFGDNIGYPLVVKPTHGSLSKHVTTNITTRGQLHQAIDIAKQYNPTYIVEEHLPGSLYRATVIGCEHVFICQKQRPHVVGNGDQTIEQLIEAKNNDPKRGSTKKKDTTLHVISKDSAEKYLSDTSHSMESVPNNDEMVVLSDTYTLAAGCDITECTNSAHGGNKEMFCKAARVLSTRLVGFDFMCPDIETSWKKQDCGIIEANTKPYADMHAHPSSGQPQPIAEAMWNTIRNKSTGANI